MIVQPAQARLILAGRKTQMRLRIREPRLVRRRNGTAYWALQFRGVNGMRTPAPQEGMRIPIAVHRRVDGERLADEVCAVVVTGFAHELLAKIDFAAARAEGHRGADAVAEFKAHWVRSHDSHWLARTERVLCPTCITDPMWPGDELGPCDTCGGDEEIDIVPSRGDGELAEAFDRRWGGVPVWAVTFALDREAPAWFLAATGRGDEHGYTRDPDQALPDEPEAVEPGRQQLITAQAHERDADRRAGIDDELLAKRGSLEQRLGHLRQVAYERGVDVRNDLRVVERGLQAIEKRIREQRAGGDRRAA